MPKQINYMLGGFQYTNNVLNFFPHAEGYVDVTLGAKGAITYNYVYQYKDHLGNNRLSYTIAEDQFLGQPTQLTILEENHYYPFGLKHTGYNTNQYQFVEVENGTDYYINISQLPAGYSSAYKYKYNGKEYQDELGLNMYDYGARNYDPAIGRWMNMDALSESYYPVSPYIYAINNPMFFVDPDGNYIDIYYGEDSKRKKRYEYQENRDYSKLEGGSDGFLADSFRALDALYVASNIEIDGKQVNVLQTLMDDKRELSVVETTSEFGSIFAAGRDFESKGKWSENSNDVIGTVHFNRTQGVVFNENIDSKNRSDYFNSDGSLKSTSKVNSPTSLLGHEMVHGYNYATNPTAHTNNRESGSVTFGKIKFKNQEEAKTTTLSSQINIKLNENPRLNHRGDRVTTQGVLSNKPARIK